MAKVEFSEETKTGEEHLGAADLLIAVAGPVDDAQLRSTALVATHAMGAAAQPSSSYSALRTVIAFPGVAGVETAAATMAESEPVPVGSELRFMPYAQVAGGSPVVPWLPAASTFQAIFAMARELGVSACAVIAADLAAFDSHFLTSMLTPILEKRCDLTMPLYPMGKFDGLVNSGILAPLSRALYGKRVRFPLASDFCVSGEVLPQMEAAAQKSAVQGQSLFWPATEAAMRNAGICQVHVDARHTFTAEGIDLSTVLSQTVGPLFADMTTNASWWQRARGSQPVPTTGFAAAPPADGLPVVISPMVETFQLGFRNLQEVWSLVLPPVAMLDLKRLARPGREGFQFPDELWVRVIYDFALAYRLRTLSRIHLLGALTPLYLGWVASYASEVGNATAGEAEQRLEKLARAFEDGKPYLLQRWRWPDRFNP